MCIFLGFNHVKFNRTDEFFYETEVGKYIYELIDGMPVEFAGAEYDEAEGSFQFYTRVLGTLSPIFRWLRRTPRLLRLPHLPAPTTTTLCRVIL